MSIPDCGVSLCRVACLALTFVGSAAVAQSPTWAALDGEILSPRRAFGLVTDPVHGHLLGFGGLRGTVASADTIDWDGLRWSLRTAVTTPTARSGQALAFDVARRRAVLFGGSSSTNQLLADTWEWNGDDWVARTVASAPSPRRDFVLVHDEARQRTVLFGGSAAIGALADTWTWDGAVWQQLGPATSPAARFECAATYDDARQRVLVFGGRAAVGPSFADTWEWDGTNWAQRAPATSPPARRGAAMASDRLRGRVVLFGGLGSGSVLGLVDTWEWDGTNWTLRGSVRQPSARFQPGMAWNPTRRAVTLFAGELLQALPSADTWEWDGTDWRMRGGQPAPRIMPAMARDPVRQRIVLFGGTAVLPSALFTDTWEYGEGGWSLQTPPFAPPGRRMAAMAWLPTTQRVVLFGGTDYLYLTDLSDTWEWDGGGWLPRFPVTPPPARYGHGMATDVTGLGVLMYGGAAGNGATVRTDTWVWDGGSWNQRFPTTTPPNGYHCSMVSYPARQRVVLYGTFGTWEWDGANWSNRVPATIPPVRSFEAMAYDPSRQVVVMSGGAFNTYGPTLGDTWEWDGTDWSLTVFAGPLTEAANMDYDAAGQRMLLFGGQANGIPLAASHRYCVCPLPAVTTLGSACPGTLGLPTLRSGQPYLGNAAMTLDLTAACPQSLCAFCCSLTALPRALGGSCTFQLDSPTVLPFQFTDVDGRAGTRVAIPDLVSLRGLTLFAQAAVLDPQSAAGLTVTAGLRLVLGD